MANANCLVLNLNLSIHQVEDGRFQGQGLEIRDHVTLPAMGFLEVAQVLGRFHELAETIKKEHVDA